jgi:hypothetical protein
MAIEPLSARSDDGSPLPTLSSYEAAVAAVDALAAGAELL